MARAVEGQFGSAVRRRRQALGLTQADLAEAAKIANETVSRIERKRLNPSVKMAHQIAVALDTTVDELHDVKRNKGAPALRQGEAKLLGLVRNLSDPEVEDVARAVKILLRVGRR